MSAALTGCGGDDGPEPGDVLSKQNINELASTNDDPIDIWSDGTTLWVADNEDAQLYAYTLSTMTRDAGSEFDLAADNGDPIGIWSDGITLWVVDNDDAQLYAYKLTTGERDAAKEFDLAADNVNPTGLWSDRTTVWVADFADDKTYAYTLATGARDAGKDFDLVSGNESPFGLWSDGTTIWIADSDDLKLYAYTLATGTRDAGKEFDLENTVDPAGLWSDGTTILVSDYVLDQIFAYAIRTISPAPTPVPASEPSLGARLPVRDINALTAAGNTSPEGLWSDGTTLWVANRDGFNDGDEKLYAYTLSTGTRDAGKDINTLTMTGNDSPRGLWSDGTTIWVANSGFGDEKLYAYTLATLVGRYHHMGSRF
ncbi:MAG: hypothetical protein GDA37_02960 [Ekhidna sp.]|nr:hypothetical protein [Ekhidna sp.]